MVKSIIAIGFIGIIILIVLASFGILNWVVTGVLSTAVIGIIGWVLNYLSKSKKKAIPKKVPKKPKRRTILDETCEVDGEAYIFYELDLDEKDEVKGEISSDEAINIYFLTRRNFTRFEKNKEFSYEYGTESVLRTKIDFTPSRSGRWYVVIENEGEEQAIVDIYLFVNL